MGKLAIAVAIAAAGCVGACARAPEPPARVVSALRGRECERRVDAQGVVHVRPLASAQGVAKAAAAGDLPVWACFGYVHGRDRAWQMDELRRIAQGRRAEIHGQEKARGDFTMRLLGLAERGRALFQRFPEAERDRLWAYAHGVNRGFADALRAGVAEFRDFGYQPEPWAPWDTLALLLLQSFDQTRQSFEQDLAEARRREAWGTRLEELFRPEGLPWDTTIIKARELPIARSAAPSPARGASTAAARALGGDFFAAAALAIGGGSNNWVLAPKRSAGGHAWLANDPHLSLRRPAFWHWVHVQSAEPERAGALDAIGASLPGIPVIASGANRHLAWGLTNAYLDVADVLDLPRAELGQVETSRPVIWIRWGFLRIPYFFRTFERTAQGWPLLPLPEVPSGRAWVLRWSGFDLEPADLTGLLEVPAARSVAELDARLARVGLPTWNFAFADTAGHIGFRAMGRAFARRAPPPWGLNHASLAEAARWPLLSPDQMPHLRDPARGWVATANNRHWPASHVFHGGRAYADGFRAFRIEELLARRSRHDLESQRLAQCDVQAVDARFLLPRLLPLVADAAAPSSTRARALRDLRDWDYAATLDCRACGVYRAWVSELMEMDVDEGALYRLLAAPTPELRERVRSAFARAAERFAGRRWGEIHGNPFTHLSDDPRFRQPPLPTPGDEDSVNPGSGRWRGDRYEQQTGASQRMLVELADPPRIHRILAGPNDTSLGPLDAPGSPWRRWRDCELDRAEFPFDWGAAAGTPSERVSL